MKKRNILLTACILISMLLVSCRSAETPPPTPTPAPTPEPTMAPTPMPSIAPSPSAVPDTPAYEITGAEFSEGDITIRYPQITGLSDAALQEQINVLIQADAAAIAEEGGTVDVEYTVMWQGVHLLSIRYDGIRMMAGAAYPTNLFYTTNIDITGGTKIRLADVVTIDAGFIETFKAARFVPWESAYGEAEDLIRENIARYDLNQAFANADKGYGLDNPDYCFSYYTEDALGISIGIPHAIGDHAEFEIGYADLMGMTKQHSIWDDFPDSPAGES